MAKIGFIYSNQGALFGNKEVIGFGSDDWHIKEIPKGVSKAMIIKNHYSHKVCNDATTHIHLGLFVKNELVGCMQYGYAMNPQSAGGIVEGTELDQYKELNRMWFCDSQPRNTESKAIGYSIKYIKNKFKRVKWIQSFADERCGGLGIVYQACSFSFYGEHLAKFWEFDGEIFHNSLITNNNRNKKRLLEAKGFNERAKEINLRQFRYIKFLDERWRKKCYLKQKPYIKHYAS